MAARGSCHSARGALEELAKQVDHARRDQADPLELCRSTTHRGEELRGREELDRALSDGLEADQVAEAVDEGCGRADRPGGESTREERAPVDGATPHSGGLGIRLRSEGGDRGAS